MPDYTDDFSVVFDYASDERSMREASSYYFAALNAYERETADDFLQLND